MNTNNGKNKVLKSVVAIALAAAVLFGGTLAWQSISQVALNEASDTVNPGGRLHDDFNGENKDVYVENFADEPIFARIRLDEYFEIVNGDDVNVITTDAVKDDKSTWHTHYFPDGSLASDYWEWATGGSTIFMPTFDKNKDSLQPDINGDYNEVETDAEGNVTQRYTDYVTYDVDEEITADATYDADTNDVEDDGVEEKTETHTAKSTLYGELVSMDEWDGSEGPYWVYDSDGWVYWAQAIAPGEATGLLLDGIELVEAVDDDWYYGINVIAQFITADDLGDKDDTGFYADPENVPSDDALTLLENIGVKVNGTTSDDDDEDEEDSINLVLNFDESARVFAGYGESIVVSVNPDEEVLYDCYADLSNIALYDGENNQLSDEQYSYDSETRTVIILDTTLTNIEVRDGSNMYAGYITQYDKDSVSDEKVDRSFDMYSTYDENPLHHTIEDSGEIYLWDDSQEFLANAWYTIELEGVDFALWSYTEIEACNPIFEVAEDGSSVNFYSSDSGSVKISADVFGHVYEMTINLCDCWLKTNDCLRSVYSYVYKGAENKLVLDYATDFELVSTGHEDGTYISGDVLYVDENESVTPVIKATTVYGEVLFDELTMKGPDEKWMVIIDDWAEVNLDETGESLWGDDILSAYYEGKKAYVRLSEADEYTEYITGPSQDEWRDVTFTLYANTNQDGTGESASWNMEVYMPY